jgi:hypothetical protein
VARLASLSATALRPAVRLGHSFELRVRHTLAGPARWTTLSALDAALSALDAALTSPLAQEAGERIRASPLAADVMEPLLRRVTASPEAERLIREVVSSRVIAGLLEELPDNDALWTLVDAIAQSPAVTEAISHQGFSFADQMAGVMRKRSQNADDHVERLARRLARRQPRDVGYSDAADARTETRPADG